jgi:glutaminase
VDPITRILHTVHEQLSDERGGALADYIPELADADPDRFGLAVSGEWLLRVGLPAKSGVSGCVIAASPAQFGIGLFSPPVDERGNSVRAVLAARRLSEAFDLDLVRHPGLSAPVIRGRDDGVTTAGVTLLEVQGELDFAAAESVLADLRALPGPDTRLLVLDLTAVTRVRPVAGGLFTAALADLDRAGVRTALVGGDTGLITGGRWFTHRADALAWNTTMNGGLT